MDKLNSLVNSFYDIWDSLEGNIQLAILLSLVVILLISISIFVNERVKKKKYLKKHDGVLIEKHKDKSHLQKIEESRIKNQNLFKNKNRI